MSYRITVKRSAERSLRKRVAPEDADRIRRVMNSLADDPRPRGSGKLRGREGQRVRPGDYRIIYEVSDEQRMATVVQVAYRRDV